MGQLESSSVLEMGFVRDFSDLPEKGVWWCLESTDPSLFEMSRAEELRVKAGSWVWGAVKSSRDAPSIQAGVAITIPGTPPPSP